MLLKTIPSVLANQRYLPANLMLLTCVGLLLILPQLRKNYPEICSTHNVPPTQNQGKKKRRRGKKTEKIPAKVARSNLGLLQKLLVLQEQHPESTKNKWYLDLHNNVTESPSALIMIQPLSAPAAIRSRRDKRSGDRYCLYLLIQAESAPVL